MYLDEDTQIRLRKSNVINDDEVLIKEGDIFIAVNVISQNRRIVSIEDKKILESDRSSKPQLLKG